MTDKPTIFISYSHQDETWKDLIVSHLNVAERQGDFDVWDDRRIDGGGDWRDEINEALEGADIAVLLISRHFLTSNFIMDHEVNVLLERKQRGGLRLYPILIRGCTWKAVDWLERLNIKPLDAKPLDSFDEHQCESVAAGMAEEIGHLLKEDRESAKQLQSLRAKAEALGERLGVTEEAVQSFLTILDQRHVDSGDLKETLEEIAGQYREMQERLTAIDRDDPVIKDLIKKAETAIDDGDYDEADDLLTQAEQRDLSAARQAAAQADQRFLNAARTRAVRAETSLTRLRYLDAAEHFAEAAEIVPNHRSSIRAGYFTQQGEALMKGNRTLEALGAYEQATRLDADEFSPWIMLGRLRHQAGNLETAEEAFRRAKAAAENISDQRSLSVSLNELGNVRVAQGDLGGAQDAFQAGLAIAERLAAADPANSGWQRDLSVSHDKIGDVRVAQGDLGGAQDAFQAGLAIAERLAAADPANSGWQRDLSVSHNKIGDVRVAQGDLGGAQDAFQASLAIAERLAAADPANSEWQRDLIVSRAKLGDLAEQGHGSESSLDHWRVALEIALELQRTGRLAPVDAWMVDTIQGRIDALIEPAAGSGG